MLQQDGTSARDTVAFWNEREMRETRRRLGACVHVNFKHEF